MDTKNIIKDEFKRGDCNYIDAIERLQFLGYDPIDAENLVSNWEDQNRDEKEVDKLN